MKEDIYHNLLLTDSFWNLSAEQALGYLKSSKNGLDETEAVNRLKYYGPNVLKSGSSTSAVFLFLLQFKSPITIMLIIAALLSAMLGDVSDTTIILFIIIFSSLLGYWQEKGALNAVNKLLKIVQLKGAVLRNGSKKEIPFDLIVPGDIICLSAGDIIPADSLLLETNQLYVDEATFTGETYPVEKKLGIFPVDTPLAKRTNTLLMGAHVISGKALALVIKTGRTTSFGKISSSLQVNAPESNFERGIKKFGYLLMEITLVLVIVIFAINVLLHKPVLDSFLFSLALAVGLTPQLLPAIISVNLSTGAKKMAQQQVIVKRLSSIENFGSMDILCSDKTGTITQGKVNLKDTTDINGNHSLKVLQYAWLNASMQQGFRNPIDEAISLIMPDPTGDFVMQAEIPYDFIRKRLTVQVKSAKENIAITKGALKSVLSVCDRVEINSQVVSITAFRENIIKQYEQMGNLGYRVLGIAYKPSSINHDITREEELKMIFLGFISLFDPPKINVKATIVKLNNLGVQLKIITGDNANVARSLALQIGVKEPKILTGIDIRTMSMTALMHKARITDVFAEVEPNQKERIIMALRKAGHVVGFLGDGINDAPALHVADVGISVDSAVDVAKEAADIVLLNQDLDVLAEGILEGRKTFTNTMKYIFMATSANFGNMFSMAGASLFLPFLPLLPKQILLTNLLTDFPEMAIATDRVDLINIQTPQKWDLKFIQRFMIIFGLLSSVFDYLTFGVLLLIMHANEKAFQTGWFTESVISAILIVLVVRTRLSFLKSLPGKYLSFATIFVFLFVLILPVTPMALWFGFIRLPMNYYLWMLLIISLYLLAAESTKRWFYLHLKKKWL